MLLDLEERTADKVQFNFKAIPMPIPCQQDTIHLSNIEKLKSKHVLAFTVVPIY